MRGQGTAKQDPARGTWFYVLDLGTDERTGKRRQMRRRGFATERAALMAMWEVRDRVEQEQEVANAGRQTVSGYLERWLAEQEHHLSPAAWTNYRTCIRRYVIPHIGSMRLTAVKPSTLTGLYATLLRRGGKGGKPLSATSVRLVHRIVSTALREAVECGLLTANPAVRAKPPRPQRAITEVWDAAQARQFLHTTRDDRLYAAWLLGLTCGMRRGELAGLRWRDVDLTRGMVAIEQQRTTDGDGHCVVKEPKGKSRRTVSLGADVVAALRALRQQSQQERMALGIGWDESSCVFTHADASPLFPERFSSAFLAASERAGVKRIRLHDLRHTAATLMICQGVHAKVVQERLGHYSAQFTMDRYSHVLETMQEDAASRMDALLSTEAG